MSSDDGREPLPEMQSALAIIRGLAENLDRFKDFSNPEYYNIQIFKTLREQAMVA